MIEKLGSMSNVKEEIRRRVPRLTMSLVIGVVFAAINIVVQQTAELSPLNEIQIPGVEQNAASLVSLITVVIAAIFLIRALSDALVLADIMTDVFVRRLGIKEERSPKRAARELIYIIVIILVVTAISPLARTYLSGDVGVWLILAIIYVALAVIIILIYDIGRILYRLIEKRAELFADRLSKIAEQGNG